VYAANSASAIEQAFNTYLKAKITAIDNKIPLAPVEIKQWLKKSNVLNVDI
jgi:hypothetical protein